MPRPSDRAWGLVVALGLLAGPACSSRVETQVVDVGRHRVRFVCPAGWEHLDHGRQQLFRRGESQLSLTDLGPATPAAMVEELEAAERLWRDGPRRDAFERVRELRAPALRFAPSRQRADFWKPWTDVTYVPEAADSAAIGPAFAALIEGTKVFAEVTPEHMVEYVVILASDGRGREIAHRERRTIHGAPWIEVETWDRVSHLGRSRVAFVVDRGYLLALAIDWGRFERTGSVFEAVLASLEVTADPPR